MTATVPPGVIADSMLIPSRFKADTHLGTVYSHLLSNKSFSSSQLILTLQITVDLEIFVVKIFSWFAQTMKMK